MNRNYTLQVIEQLVRKLSAAGIRFCRWKGNEHLDTTLARQDDLDLLFHKEDSLKILAIFADLGFKNYSAPAWKYNSGVQNFIGFDETSGKIVHLHTYFRLVMGDLQLQEYRLPWEDDILASAVPTEEDIPMPVPGPEAGMLLILVRTSLKTRLRGRLFRAEFRKNLLKDYERNRVWLHERIDESKLKTLSEKWLHPDLWPQVREAVFSPATFGGMSKLGKRVAAQLASFRTYGRVESLIGARFREAAWAFGAINKRYHWAIPWGRTSGHGGAIICILGADGSGKSTLTSEMIRWLTFKLDAIPIYMGSGDGSGSILRLPLKLVRKVVPARFQRRKTSQGNPANSDKHQKTGDSLLLRAGLLIWGLVLALEKRDKLVKARKAANLGMIVIADRYPQAQIFGFNDGPLLQDFATSRFAWIRAFASWELGVYRLAEKIAPDLVIKLAVSPDVAISRKPDMPIEEIVRRNNAVESLSFPPETRVVTISADLPKVEVSRLAKKAVWAVA
jgi:hypothetical protein